MVGTKVVGEVVLVGAGVEGASELVGMNEVVVVVVGTTVVVGEKVVVGDWVVVINLHGLLSQVSLQRILVHTPAAILSPFPQCVPPVHKAVWSWNIGLARVGLDYVARSYVRSGC